MFGFKKRHREILAAIKSADHNSSERYRNLKRKIDMLSKDVQDTLDRVTKLQQIVPAIQEGFSALQDKQKTLTAQIAELQASGKATGEDLAAIHQANSDLGGLIDQLGAAIPANTTETAPEPAPAPVDPDKDPEF